MPDRSHTIYRRYIPEQKVPGKPLGRHVHQDSRSLAYPYLGAQVRETVTLKTVLWKRDIPILDQGDVGSCTGNAETGALGSDPLNATLPAGHPALNEAEALKLYSAAEDIDGDGPYPPQDNGSTGLSVCKAAKNAGLISGYTHATTLDETLQALMAGPVIIGVNWYDSFDQPASDGTIAISRGAQVRGGHEFVVRGVDVDTKMLHADNSWGTSWGVNGSMQLSYATYQRLLSEQGDCTVSSPLSAPPTPVPVPTPTPAPTPVPPDPNLLAELVALLKRDAGKVEAWLKAHGL